MKLSAELQWMAFLIAGLLPFFTVLRWKGLGFLIAMALGWGLVHAANFTDSVREPVDAVFRGVWATLGWAYMLVWCLLIAGGELLFRFAIRRIRALSTQNSQP